MGAPSFEAEAARVDGKNILIEFDYTMHSRVVAVLGGRQRAVGDFTSSESIRVSGNEIPDFILQKQTHEPVRDRRRLRGRYDNGRSQAGAIRRRRYL